ncbi:MAG TPA: hypothetical protein VGN01_02065 [Acidobacteriaceae bacterium]
MKRAALQLLLALGLLGSRNLGAQEAAAGVDLRTTLSGQLAASSIFTQPAVSESAAQPGFRAMLYPTVKFNDHWAITGAWQLDSRPYFFDTFVTPGHGVKGNLLQATLNYSRVSEKGSFLLRAGEMSTAFGSFPLRYDDADNPLANVPLGYGYYYAPVSSLGVAGAQIDATRGRFDGRVQFANSSPANPRSLFARDQYGNWAGGGGVHIRQGLRIGASTYRGPYLDRHYPFFFPGEANPNTLPAHAWGIDAQWTHGHWNVQGEFQRFAMQYKLIPTYREDAGYAEVRRVLSPRWYIAERTGYSSATFGGNTERYEFAAGFRPNRFELLKAAYELDHHGSATPANDKTFFVQFVTILHASHAIR